MTRIAKLRALGLLLALLLSGRARLHGDSPATEFLSLSLDQLVSIKVDKVYAASKREESVSSAPSSVSIVTADDIKHFGYRTLADVLNSVRGLDATTDRNYDFLGVRGVNRPDDFGGRNLLLVDGPPPE